MDAKIQRAPALAAFIAFITALLAATAVAAPITISSVVIFKDNQYSSSIALTPAGASCTPRALFGNPGTLIGPSAGGVDGFDCGLNLPVATQNPGLVNVTGGMDIKIGEAVLNERALIALGTFPVGDATALDQLDMVIAFTVNGTLVQFNGNVTDFVGGAPASGDPTLIAACGDPNQTTFPQCVHDTALDFRLAFVPSSVVPNVVTIGSETYTFTIPALAFFDFNVIPINVHVEVSSSVDEPGSLAMLGMTLLIAAAIRRFGRKPIH